MMTGARSMRSPAEIARLATTPRPRPAISTTRRGTRVPSISTISEEVSDTWHAAPLSTGPR